jgi:hypothetical protein
MRRLFQLVLMLFIGGFVLGVLVFGICVALLSVLWSLLRGRKPAMFTVFQYFRQASRQFGQGIWTGPAANPADVVDVQAHEVHPVLNGSDGTVARE